MVMPTGSPCPRSRPAPCVTASPCSAPLRQPACRAALPPWPPRSSACFATRRSAIVTGLPALRALTTSRFCFAPGKGIQYFEDALEARGIRTYVYKGLGFFDAPEVQDLQALLRYLAEPDSDLRAAELLRSRFVRLSDVALVRLAPAFAQALGAESPADRDLDEPDRGLLVRARASLASWLPLADRISPSELVDRIMRESAYLYELRGRRLDQARENVKKVRALIRRVESRGYATLGRLADYFETLRAGDESNAIVEASGCVNLMTIHAAKGLEFPIVFVVNLHIPGRGTGAGFTVIEHGVDGEPEVAFRSSPGLALEEQREEEELRRLVYVALTRARDRLYLATELDPRGRVPRKARSLAGLLPVGLTDALAAAATATSTVTWTSPAGDFTFRVCLGAEPGPAPPAIEVPEPPAVRPDANLARAARANRRHGGVCRSGTGRQPTRCHGGC